MSYLPEFAPVPGAATRMAEALQEARQDLQTLVDHFLSRPVDDVDLATAQLVQGLLLHPAWDRLMLASVLGSAVADIARRQVTS